MLFVARRRKARFYTPPQSARFFPLEKSAGMRYTGKTAEREARFPRDGNGKERGGAAMEKARVACVPCADYTQERVDEAVRQGVALLGGIERFVSREERILLKPNLLGKALPQRAVTTHPAVFSAVARLMREAGYTRLSYGDSPGNPAATPEKAAECSGILAEARKWDIPLADFHGGAPVEFPAGRACQSFYLCNGVRQADAIINLPKMKTHALERITGAVKNMYGCIWGPNKAMGHARFPYSQAFADMLADLNACLRPRLHILDGVEAMEGNGPTSGTPVHMGVLLFSDDPVALDSVFARLVGLEPALAPTCLRGSLAGLGQMEDAQITVLTPEGEMTPAQAAARYGKMDFSVFRGKMKKGLTAKLLPLLPFLQDRPRVNRRLCVGCGLCQQACPVESKAVKAGKGKKARYDYRKCIRCYCCQEMCPQKAISVHRSALSRLFENHAPQCRDTAKQ